MLAPPPDLVVTSLEGSNNGSVRTGDTLYVRYMVSNEGAGPSFENYWTDFIVSKACLRAVKSTSPHLPFFNLIKDTHEQSDGLVINIAV